jgi:hypothetical protein
MAILDGLRGGQYFGFAPQNVPVINLMEMLPTQAASSPVSASTDTGDFTPVDTWAGDTQNYNASYMQGKQEMAQGREYLNKAMILANNGDMENAKKIYDQGTTLYTTGRTRITQTEALAPSLETLKKDFIAKNAALNQNVVAVDPSNNLPFNFRQTSDNVAGKSLLNPNNYIGGKAYNVGEMEEWMNTSTVNKEMGTFDFETGRKGNNIGTRAAGATKGTDYVKTLGGYYSDIKNMANVAESYRTDNNYLGLTNLGGYSVILNQSLKESSTNNLQNIMSLSNTAWNLLPEEEQLDAKQRFTTNLLSTGGANLINDTSRVVNVSPEAYAEWQKVNPKGTKEEFLNSLHLGPWVAHGDMIPLGEGGKEGFNVQLYVADPRLMESKSESDQMLFQQQMLAATDYNNLDALTQQYVSNQAMDFAGVYSYDQRKLDLNRSITNPPKSGSGGGGFGSTKVKKLNNYEGATIEILSNINQGKTNNSNFRFNLGDKTSNISVASASIGAYTGDARGQSISTDNIIFANAGGSMVGITGLSSAWTIQDQTGQLSTMPNVGIPALKAEESYYANTVNSVKSLFGGDDVIGLTDDNDKARFWSSNQGLLPIKDLNSTLKYVDNLNSVSFSDTDKVALKGMFTILDRFPIGPSSGQFVGNIVTLKREINKYYNDPNISVETKNIMSEVLNNAGRILYYKEHKNDYNDPTRALDKSYQFITTPESYYFSTGKIGAFNATGGWDAMGAPTLFENATLQRNVSNSKEGIIEAMGDMPIYVTAGSIKGNMTIKQLLQYYGEYDDVISGFSPGDKLTLDQTISRLFDEMKGDLSSDVKWEVPFVIDAKTSSIQIPNSFIDLTVNKVTGTYGGKDEADIYNNTNKRMGTNEYKLEGLQLEFYNQAVQEGDPDNVQINYYNE